MGHKTICVSNVSCLCVCAEEPSGEKSEDATAPGSRSVGTNPATQRRQPRSSMTGPVCDDEAEAAWWQLVAAAAFAIARVDLISVSGCVARLA